MGLIRGQPRQPWHGTMPMSQPSTPGLGGPGPQTSLRRSMSAREAYRRSSSGYAVMGTTASYQLGVSGPISGKRRTFSLCAKPPTSPHRGRHRGRLGFCASAGLVPGLRRLGPRGAWWSPRDVAGPGTADANTTAASGQSRLARLQT